MMAILNLMLPPIGGMIGGGDRTRTDGAGGFQDPAPRPAAPVRNESAATYPGGVFVQAVDSPVAESFFG
jgi:hypothetical protein